MDLNLYPVFIEIMRHGSVSKAADALGLTQPATSNALSRLRQQMGDPLFVRTKTGMLPTHFALGVLPKIKQSIKALQELQLDTPEELPLIRSFNRHFKIVMSDLEETLFLPDMIEQLATDAPGVSIEVRPYQREHIQKNLETGATDFVLAHLIAPSKNVVSKPLSAQDFVCLARAGHPGIDGNLSLKDYTKLGHILVAPDRGGTKGMADTQLQKMGEKRHVVCSVPHFLSACVLTSRSDHLLTVPRLLGEKIADDLSLRIHDLPFPMPGFSIGFHWHWTRESDPEHASFRNYVLGLFS
ncbi:MAG: LysR family transcriptional regulator [Rhodospirillales bacterium]|nr:LysR family transcriptional regulator [Rhodospirillales bacterium]